MSSDSQSLPTGQGLFGGLSRLSRWPDEPFRSWTKPGCRFLAVECWIYKGESEAYFSNQVIETEKIPQWLRSDPRLLGNELPVAGIKMLVIEGSSDPLGSYGGIV